MTVLSLKLKPELVSIETISYHHNSERCKTINIHKNFKAHLCLPDDGNQFSAVVDGRQECKGVTMSCTCKDEMMSKDINY